MTTTGKTIVRGAAVAVPVLVLGAAGWASFRFHSYSPPDPDVAVDPASAAYFLDSYESSRDAFRREALALKDAYPGAVLTAVPVPGRADADLAVDVLYVPAQRARKRLLVLSSGVHGVEGFAGSAVTRMFLREFITARLLDTTGILVIHAVNPYAFKHIRRATENNVDLNRNSDVDRRLFRTVNAEYAGLNDLVNPRSRVDTRSAAHVLFPLRVVARIAATSRKSFRQAVAGGQYEFPDGILYGGGDFEPQIAALPPFIADAMNAYPLVMNIDLHTGYGERGTLHLFPNPVRDGAARSLMESVFRGRRIDWGDGDDFYAVTGDFSGFLGKLLTNAVYLPMTFEYGTMNSQTTLGAARTLHITLLENQGARHGYVSREDGEKVRRDFMELFCPSSPAWRTKVILDTRELFRTCLDEFAKH